jgi:hypothetical protein
VPAKREEPMRIKAITLVCAAALWAAPALARGDYPVDQFEKITQCMSDPSCTVDIEDRIDGPVDEAGDLTYRYPLCLGGCVMVCTKDACWCESDDKC